MRCHDNKGVTIPSQNRFVEYFGFVIGTYDNKNQSLLPCMRAQDMDMEAVVAVSMLNEEGADEDDEEDDEGEDEDGEEEEGVEDEKDEDSVVRDRIRAARVSMVAFGGKPVTRAMDLWDPRFVKEMKRAEKELVLFKKMLRTSSSSPSSSSSSSVRGSLPNVTPVLLTSITLSSLPKFKPFNPSFKITCWGQGGMGDTTPIWLT